MNTIRLILLISTIILFNGCSNGDSAENCLTKGYKGIVINKSEAKPNINCSDGEVTTGGTHYKTSNGEYPIKLVEHNTRSNIPYTTEYVYIKF